MRELNLLIATCAECPYFQRHEGVPLRVCRHSDTSPFAPSVNVRTEIDPKCPLPEFHGVEMPELTDEDFEDFAEESMEDLFEDVDIPPFNTFSNRLMEVQALPAIWTKDLTPEERERFNQEMDQKMNAKLREQGYELSFDEFDFRTDEK